MKDKGECLTPLRPWVFFGQWTWRYVVSLDRQTACQVLSMAHTGDLTMVYAIMKSEQSVWCAAKSQEMVTTLERVEVPGA